MRVTDVRIRKLTNNNKMRAIASICLYGEIVVHDIKIIQGVHGLFVAMPSKRNPIGEFRDIAHPITNEARDDIHGAILAAYKAALLLPPIHADGEDSPASPSPPASPPEALREAAATLEDLG